MSARQKRILKKKVDSGELVPVNRLRECGVKVNPYIEIEARCDDDDSQQEEPDTTKDVSRLIADENEVEEEEMLVGTELYVQPGELAPWEAREQRAAAYAEQGSQRGLTQPIPIEQVGRQKDAETFAIVARQKETAASLAAPGIAADQPDGAASGRKRGRPKGSTNKDAEARRAAAAIRMDAMRQAREQAAEKKKLVAAQKILEKEKLKNDKKREELKNKEYDLFLTYVQKRSDIENPGTMERTQDFVDQTPEIKKSFAGQERGPRMHNLHLHFVGHTVGVEARQLTRKFKKF